MTRSILFIILLFLISIFGLALRFIDYDRIPPFDATKDEFFYPWAGMTLIQTGTPKSWSILNAYPDGEVVYKWGTWYRLVSPWLDKPPLYSLITGSWVLLNGARDLFDVRLSVLRIVPIFLSFFTIFFTGILAKKIFSPTVGIIASLLYAFTPTIVLSNRLSLTENLLTPLVIITLVLFLTETKHKLIQPILAGLGVGLALLTKDIAISLVFTLLIFCIVRRKWQALIIISFISGIAFIVHPAIGYYYDWQLFTRIISDYHREFASAGPPGLIATIFLHPIIERKGYPFLDGTMLAGYLLFFTSPFWMPKHKYLGLTWGLREYPSITANRFSSFWYRFNKNIDKFSIFFKSKERVFILFPFIYITFLALLASGANFSFYGWHVYPLFPFLMILLAKILYDIWQEPDFLKSLFLYLVLASSSVRFLVILNSQLQNYWQWILAIILLILIGSHFLKRGYRKIVFFAFFIVFLVVNVIVVINLEKIYPSFPQPLNNYNL